MKQRLEATHFILQYNGNFTHEECFTSDMHINSLSEFVSYVNEQDAISLIAIFKIKYK